MRNRVTGEGRGGRGYETEPGGERARKSWKREKGKGEDMTEIRNRIRGGGESWEQVKKRGEGNCVVGVSVGRKG